MTQTIDSLATDHLVATDEGTHAMPETIRVYERLDGSRYGVRLHAGSVIGAVPTDTESAHGRLRYLSTPRAKARREQIAHLRATEIEAVKSAERIAAHRESLLRGWDGYRFIGVEDGRRLAAAV